MSGNIENDWRPGASRHAMEARAQLLADIRAFFSERRGDAVRLVGQHLFIKLLLRH